VIGPAGEGSIRRLYWLTAVLGVSGFIALWPMQGFRTALAFLLGALASLGNLFLFGYLSRAISPGDKQTKPWEARAFISRYLLLFAGGYVIVKALGVKPLPVIVGLLTSTAAVVLSIVLELFERLFTRLTTR
jgi:4-hydroxybenzoate polyprenyltransferase